MPSVRIPRQVMRYHEPTVDSLRLATISYRPTQLTPNLLIAGVTHAGARGLADALGRHRQVKLPTGAIDHFTPLRYGQPLRRPLSDYDRHFTSWSQQRYRCEVSPRYFDGGAAMIDAITRDLPSDLRVVIVLRDPAERLWASYHTKVARGRLPQAMTYETFVERCLALHRSGTVGFVGNRHFRVMSAGHYIDHLPLWQQAFGDRLRVVFAEDFEADAGSHLNDLVRWLGLQPRDLRHGQQFDVNDLFVSTDDPYDSGRRLWPALMRPGETLRWPTAQAARENESVAARLVRRLLPQQRDRVRVRTHRLYAETNAALATYLTDLGYENLPQWLAK